jgi:hypothetical protein
VGWSVAEVADMAAMAWVTEPEPGREPAPETLATTLAAPAAVGAVGWTVATELEPVSEPAPTLLSVATEPVPAPEPAPETVAMPLAAVSVVGATAVAESDAMLLLKTEMRECLATKHVVTLRYIRNNRLAQAVWDQGLWCQSTVRRFMARRQVSALILENATAQINTADQYKEEEDEDTTQCTECGPEFNKQSLVEYTHVIPQVR